jgi:hypothetical protein
VDAVISALGEAGYKTNQTSRAPERDKEFFEFLMRDAKVMLGYDNSRLSH